jgi:heme A synthase
VAALVTVLAIAAALWAWRRYRARPDVLWPALAAAVLVPLQALLGAIVVWLELPSWIVGIHFVVGMIFLGTTVVTAARAWTPPGRRFASEAFAATAWGTAAVGLALVSLGASVVATHAESACGTDWPSCNGGFARGGSLAGVQVAHRSLAYVVAILAVALLVLAWRGAAPKLAGALPVAAVLGQISIGISLVRAGQSGADHALEMLHVGGAGGAWIVLVGVAAVAGRPTLALFRGEPAGKRDESAKGLVQTTH